MSDREKIIDIIERWHCQQGRDVNGYTIWSLYDNERLADSLIEAGIGDVIKYKKHRIIISNPVCRDICQEGLRLPPEFDLKQLYGTEEVEQIVKERNEWKKRAEVAEQKATVWKDCANKWQKYYKEQAERELAEENYGKKEV